MEFKAYTSGTTADGSTPYVGIFGTTVTSYDIATVAARIETSGGFVTSSWQAQFALENPEPATVLLCVGG